MSPGGGNSNRHDVYQRPVGQLFAVSTIAMVLLLSGCQNLWYLFLNYAVDTAPDRFTVEAAPRALSIPIYTSKPLEEAGSEFDHLVVMVHGAGLNAGEAYAAGREIVAAFEAPGDRFLVVAPQFLEGVDPDKEGLLLWDVRSRRRDGMNEACCIDTICVASRTILVTFGWRFQGSATIPTKC